MDMQEFRNIVALENGDFDLVDGPSVLEQWIADEEAEARRQALADAFEKANADFFALKEAELEAFELAQADFLSGYGQEVRDFVMSFNPTPLRVKVRNFLKSAGLTLIGVAVTYAVWVIWFAR